ncbi:MAG: hypothetical protein GY711_08630 [bacterium]|nr:hypothetical protein [bacterium]
MTDTGGVRWGCGKSWNSRYGVGDLAPFPSWRTTDELSLFGSQGADFADFFYGGVSVTGGAGWTWTDGAVGGCTTGLSEITALNILPDVPGSPETTEMYFDDLRLIELFATGTSYCGPAVPNSTGQPGVMSARGRTAASDNYLTLTASQLPPGELGYFLVSRTAGFFQPPASNGFVCLSGDIGRFNAPMQLGVGPEIELFLDLTDLPTNAPGSQAVMPGETLRFQLWHQDVGGSGNFTDGLEITFS